MLGIAATAFKNSRKAGLVRVGKTGQNHSSSTRPTRAYSSHHGSEIDSSSSSWKKYAVIGGSILVRSPKFESADSTQFVLLTPSNADSARNRPRSAFSNSFYA